MKVYIWSSFNAVKGRVRRLGTSTQITARKLDKHKGRAPFDTSKLWISLYLLILGGIGFGLWKLIALLFR